MDKNFYEELKQDIDKALEKGDLTSALKLIEEELSMPYIPKDIEEFLKEKHAEISREVYAEEKTLSAEKILDMLASKIETIDKYDLSNMLGEYNLSKYLEDIRKLLLLEEELLAIEVKRNILQILLDQNIKETFMVQEEEDKREVNLENITPFKQDKRFIELSSKIQDILFKNPVALEIALNMLEVTFSNLMFDGEDVDFTDTEVYLSLTALKMLGDEEAYAELLKKYENKLKRN